MITKEDVQSFLNQFNAKMEIFDIYFRDDREKNLQTLKELELIPTARKVIIENLLPEDYVQGPIIDELYNLGEMWVFGKDIKNREIYIKIQIGMANTQTICISFHIAEHPLKYPFKKN